MARCPQRHLGARRRPLRDDMRSTAVRSALHVGAHGGDPARSAETAALGNGARSGPRHRALCLPRTPVIVRPAPARWHSPSRSPNRYPWPSRLARHQRRRRVALDARVCSVGDGGSDRCRRAGVLGLGPPGRATIHEWCGLPNTPVQVTTAMGVEELPRGPGRANVAYASSRARAQHYQTKRERKLGHLDRSACGGTPINRTGNRVGNDSVPSWSPDGSQIAFSSAREAAGATSWARSWAPRRIARRA